METHNIRVIDLHFGTDESIAAFLIRSSEGPVLIETGPESTWDQLVAGIKEAGYRPEQIKHVLLSHIHFDHAGAAWKLAQSGANIYVHPKGLPHLQNPEKLWNSAKMIYGDDMERLWGSMEPIPGEQLHPADDGDTIRIGDTVFRVLYTPGHAVHHNAYQLGDVIFTGDVAGVKIGNGPVQAPCPPPDIHIELWLSSIQKIRAAAPAALYLTHFGRQEQPEEILDQLTAGLQDWSRFIKSYFDKGIPEQEVLTHFEAYTREGLLAKGLDEKALLRYSYANPAGMSVSGLYRYWKLKEQGRL